MPVCFIEGPTGLSKESKKELIGKVLETMVEAYQMPDDRVYIKDHVLTDIGHTIQDSNGIKLSIQTQPARVVCSLIAPPGLRLDAKRKMFRNLTETIATVYKIEDKEDILVFLNEHPLENVASNGYMQTENPAFESPATT
jgi:phenylpyruvate tautomerase PptA (4-oxalocrotonate tautomerase family)